MTTEKATLASLHAIGLYPSTQADVDLILDVADDQGFPQTTDGVVALVKEIGLDSVVPCICPECKMVQDGEGDARENYCEGCEGQTVKSVLVLLNAI